MSKISQDCELSTADGLRHLYGKALSGAGSIIRSTKYKYWCVYIMKLISW